MPMDGRYSTRSQGRRCAYAHGWAVQHKEPGMAVCICTGCRGAMDGKERRMSGCTVCRKEPWRRCCLSSRPTGEILNGQSTRSLPLVEMTCIYREHVFIENMYLQRESLFYIRTLHVGVLSDVMILLLTSHSCASSASCSNQALAEPRRKE